MLRFHHPLLVFFRIEEPFKSYITYRGYRTMKHTTPF